LTLGTEYAALYLRIDRAYSARNDKPNQTGAETAPLQEQAGESRKVYPCSRYLSDGVGLFRFRISIFGGGRKSGKGISKDEGGVGQNFGCVVGRGRNFDGAGTGDGSFGCGREAGM